MPQVTPVMDRIVRRSVAIPCLIKGLNLPCWTWTGADTRGYGVIGVGRSRTELIHRVVYGILIGPIPPGLELDHLCRVPACWNPWHLEPVTHEENMIRAARAHHHNRSKISCPACGSTYAIRSDRKRICRTCVNRQHREWYARDKIKRTAKL